MRRPSVASINCPSIRPADVIDQSEVAGAGVDAVLMFSSAGVCMRSG